MLSLGELECPLPPSPLSNTSNSAVYKWLISVSNDGETYSNQLHLTVYDSKCLDCQCSGHCQLKVSNMHSVFHEYFGPLTYAVTLALQSLAIVTNVRPKLTSILILLVVSLLLGLLGNIYQNHSNCKMGRTLMEHGIMHMVFCCGVLFKIPNIQLSGYTSCFFSDTSF